MNKILSLFTICVILAVVGALNYDFQVSLANIKNKDGDLNGNLIFL